VAAKTLFLTNTALSTIYQEISETSPGAEATTSPVTGWVVAKTAPTVYSEFRTRTERAANTFSGTVVPDGSIDTTNGDCWRTTNAYTGTFAANNWVFTARVRATSAESGADGRCRFRLFRSANADGTSATEITSGTAVGSGVTDLLTSVSQDSAVTVALGAVTLANEYLFVQVAWEIQGASGSSTADVNVRIGTSSTPRPPTRRSSGASPAKTLVPPLVPSHAATSVANVPMWFAVAAAACSAAKISVKSVKASAG